MGLSTAAELSMENWSNDFAAMFIKIVLDFPASGEWMSFIPAIRLPVNDWNIF